METKSDFARRLIIALIAAGAVIAVPVIEHHLNQTPATQINNALFTGYVRTQSGAPIAGAQVIFAQDQAAPESAFSDVHGYFTFRIKPTTTFLHLEVSAQSFASFSENPALSRTGPEEIRLRALGK